MMIARYQPERDHDAWNAFVRGSKNGTFLLDRGFMDYHADRFADHSLVVRDKSDKIRALLPGNIHEGVYYSHQGLTYGGLITDDAMTTPVMIETFEEILTYLLDQGITRLVYKTIPWIYHRRPAEEDRYALFLAVATLCRRDVLAVVDLKQPLGYQQRRKRMISKANSAGLTYREETVVDEFHAILSETLAERHAARPVHTCDELQMLRDRFPTEIRLFTVQNREGATIGGVVTFVTPRVVHVQYIAANAIGREVGALDYLFDRLMTETFASWPYFDFGISNEQAGRILNRGLIEQKEGFGARAVVHDHYELSLAADRPGVLRGAMS